MTDSPEDRGRQSAIAAWEGESVRLLGVGLIATDRPLSAKPDASPFYAASLGCEATDDKFRFCHAYNATIAELLKEHGMPAWAPGRRRPDRQETLDLLAAEGKPMEQLTLEHPPYEHRMVESLRGRWGLVKGSELRVWCRHRERGVLLLGGDLSPKVGKVEILDVKEKQWMASYEYLRKHVSELPWDGLGA